MSDPQRAAGGVEHSLSGIARPNPRNDAEGVLQDVQWSSGAFCFFHSYRLGNMLAAQLLYAGFNQIPYLEANIEKEDFSSLLN